MYATRQEIRRAAGRLIICGLPGPQVTAETKELLREVRPVGVILFAHNIESPEQVAELNRELKDLRAKDPLLICVDQVGGRVARIRSPATVWPAMRELGRLDDVALTQVIARALGRELRAMNFDVDFAPVLDVDTNPANPVIGDRSFGRDAELCARHGLAFAAGLRKAGVSPCGKHFPGHGDTTVDSHIALPKVEHELARLREIEWVPFKATIERGLEAVMTAHVVTEAIDQDTPATFSRKVLGHLRDALGFAGVIVSDDIEMKAVADRYRVADMAVRGLNAGIDVFLACHSPEVILELYRGIVHGAEDERIDHETLLAAEARVTRWRDQFYQPGRSAKGLQEVVGCPRHLELAAEVNARMATG